MVGFAKMAFNFCVDCSTRRVPPDQVPDLDAAEDVEDVPAHTTNAKIECHFG